MSIDKEKLLEWIARMSLMYEEHGYNNHLYALNAVTKEIESGTFDINEETPILPQFQKGDKVTHPGIPQYGTGIVLEISKSGKKARVDFSEIDDWDKKKCTYAPYPSYYSVEKLKLVKEED